MIAAVAAYEAATSRLQACLLHRVAREIAFRVDAGPSDSLATPAVGPYDERLGYLLLPRLADSLVAHGYRIAAQARSSPRLLDLERRGLYPIYREPTQTGLSILDRGGRPLYRAAYPESVYASYEAIPPLVIRTLLFIENRELLDDTQPRRNPAVEWDRLAKAAFDQLVRVVDTRHENPGGSTLATQIEKYRHSREGRTATPRDKLRQMAAASLRAYQDDEQTAAARRRIVLDFINSVPLAALPGYGEVSGLPDGLRTWYDTDVHEVNRLLADAASGGGAALAARGEAYRKVVSLFIAHRRPTTYLVAKPDLLGHDTERYLRLLAASGVIAPELRDAALAAHPPLRRSLAVERHASFIERKGANLIRTRLLGLLGLEQLGTLDRIDLVATSTLDAPVQDRVTALLKRLGDRAFVDSVGLRAERLLERGDPAGVLYSFTLYERVGDENLLRVQADTFDQPFDINEGIKLDLGSTAKLRTLVTYLDIVAGLHERFAGLSADSLGRVAASPRSDAITRWAARRLAAESDTSLGATLDAALDRAYSASPKERFFTGGGLHTFANFESEDDEKVLTVREAFRRSVNLVFIRLMRDIVAHEVHRMPGFAPEILEGRDHPARRALLSRFAEQEGREFLVDFLKTYLGKTPDDALATLSGRARKTPRRLATLFRSVRPDATAEEMAAFLRERLPGARLTERSLASLYASCAREMHGLADRAYVAGVHPIELWLVEYLHECPEATSAEAIEAGREARQEAYAWLFKSRDRAAQNQRIRMVLEVEAFHAIHESWKRQGYPFGSLVPSLATSIGSSADRPSALAELVGILVNDGVRRPAVRIEKLHFAKRTPYETLFERGPSAGERVLATEVAAVARAALVDIVENGTARRAFGAIRRAGGVPIPIGGKTGTGDHRFETFGRRGQLIESRVVSRTATFAFLIGDRFFGTVSAHVKGPQAAHYRFTSSLPVQILALLGPALAPLVDAAPPIADAAAHIAAPEG